MNKIYLLVTVLSIASIVSAQDKIISTNNKIFEYTIIKPNYINAQVPPKGFFIGGCITALMMNGKGEMNNEDFDVTDDLFELHTVYNSGKDSLNVDLYKGGGWKNKLLPGLRPIVGYRLTPQIVISGSFSFYAGKTGKQSEIWNSSYVSGYSIRLDENLKYSQKTIQILVQFYPKTWKGIFFDGGVEIVNMKAELDSYLKVTYQDGSSDELSPWKAKGNDIALGFVLGGGIELPLPPKNLFFIGTAQYSFTKYNRDELLVFEYSVLPVTNDPNIDIKLGVGGLNLSIGLRKYFGSK